MFEATVSEEATGRHVVKVAGEVDLATSDSLLATVTRLLDDRGPIEILVDLGEVRFLDSSGVRALLLAQRAAVACGGSLTVAGAHGVVARVLQIAAVDTLLGATG